MEREGGLIAPLHVYTGFGNTVAVTDQKSKEYMACYKFGLYGALTMFEGEWTVQRLLEFLGTIN